MIELDRLSKTYRVPRREAGLRAAVRSLFHREYVEVQAVSDLSFRIGAAERVGFLGPNGAGKTTTLKMLSGLLWPSAGRVRVLGFEPQRRDRELLRQITLVMGQKQQLIWDLPPVDTFDLNRAVYDIDRREHESTLDELVALLGLEQLITKPTRQLSLGERMKCELAAALLHRPRILFLDEPTIGLDVTMQATMRAFIEAYSTRHSATVLLTSHYMDDVKALCPRVVIIDRGTLRYDGNLESLVRETAPDKRISVRLARAVPRQDLERFATVVESSDAHAAFRVEPASLPESVRQILEGLPVVDLKVEDPPLAEVMAQIFATGGAPLRAEADSLRSEGGARGGPEGPPAEKGNGK